MSYINMSFFSIKLTTDKIFLWNLYDIILRLIALVSSAKNYIKVKNGSF